MRQPILLASLLFLLSACPPGQMESTSDTSPSCDGFEGCPCVEEMYCFEGLSCIAGTCWSPIPDTDTDAGTTMDDASTTAIETTSTGGEVTTGEESSTTEDITSSSSSGETSGTSGDASYCGDGVTDEDKGEECDDGQNGDQDDGCTDFCLKPACGDGFVQINAGEHCEDGNTKNGDGCSAFCHNEHIIFVTLNKVSPTLQEIAEFLDSTCSSRDECLEKWCAMEAADAGLEGTFFAWVSTSTMQPADELTENPFDGDYVALYPFQEGPTIIATGSEHLLDPNQDNLNIINSTAWGTVIPGNELALTGTKADGTLDVGGTCDDWMTNDNSSNLTFGRLDSVSEKWTQNGPGPYCSYPAIFHIYCVETSP